MSPEKSQLEKIRDFMVEQDQFARHTGIELLEADQGYARARLQIQPCHLNGAGSVHGGAIFTLADFVFAVAANSRGQLAVGINTSTCFILPAHQGTLYAEARELACNNKLCQVEVDIYNDQQERVARFQGTAYRKRAALLPPD